MLSISASFWQQSPLYASEYYLLIAIKRLCGTAPTTGAISLRIMYDCPHGLYHLALLHCVFRTSGKTAYLRGLAALNTYIHLSYKPLRFLKPSL